MEARQTFDEVADLYGEVRPGYPAALFDDLATVEALGPSVRVLEVGCGAGQATGDLAARAAHVVALDPGGQLIAQARARVAAANADFVVCGFEDYVCAPGSFDLVASAQAWHWIAPRVSFAKAARALADGGALAVFGHVPMPPPEPFLSAFEMIYTVEVPGLWGSPPPQAAYLPSGPFAGQFDVSGLFGPVSHQAYPWTWTVSAPTLGKYLRTDSSYRSLSQDRRFALFDALEAAVDRLGGTIPLSWETHLYLARKL